MKKQLIRFAYLLAALPMLLAVLSNTALAVSCPSGMSNPDCAAIQGTWENWVPDDAANSSTCSIPLVGSDNLTKIYNFLIGKGLTPNQTLGFIGNWIIESGLDPKIDQMSHTDTDAPARNSGYGLAQWTDSGRQDNLVKYAEDNGGRPGDLAIQLGFAWQEISNSPMYSELTGMTDLWTIVDNIMKRYERPADQSSRQTNNRYNAALGAAKELGISAGQAAVDTSTKDQSSNTNLTSMCSGATTTPIDGAAIDLAKQILSNSNITLTPPARNDIEATANGQPAQPGPPGNGASGAQGASNCQPVNLNPELLKVALAIAHKYKYQINDIVSNHQCDTARHPKGEAMDIFYVANQPLNDNWWANDNNIATVNDIASIVDSVGSYQKGFGVGCSATSKIHNPGNLVIFNDSCYPQDEIHIDVRGAP